MDLTKTSAVIMLTDNDLTVDDADRVFREGKDVPVPYWGFKSVGQTPDVLYELAKVIKAAGKELFLESITYTREEYDFLAEFSAKAGVQCVLGTLYDEKLHKDLQACGTKYYPFVGKTPGYPAKIIKSMEEIRQDMEKAVRAGVEGVSIPAYMHDDYTGFEILSRLREEWPDMPVLVAGRVSNRERIEEMFRLRTSYTIGGAIFKKEFAPEGSYGDNVQALYDLNQEIGG